MAEDEAPMDVSRKFVRLVERRPDGLVEFEFSIADPTLFVEMLLPESAYEEFCKTNQVMFLEGERPTGEAAAEWDWHLHEATHQRFR
jgi:phenol/toluene 2-monooxygenase (NADH) P0/A0